MFIQLSRFTPVLIITPGDQELTLKKFHVVEQFQDSGNIFLFNSLLDHKVLNIQQDMNLSIGRLYLLNKRKIFMFIPCKVH